MWVAGTTSVPTPTSVGGSTLTTLVNAGLSNIHGAVTVNFGQGTDSLNVNDQAQPFNQTFTLASGSVSRSGAAPITFGSGINFVTVNAGSGDNTFNVSGTENIFTTTLNTGASHSTVNVDGTGFGGTFTINEGPGGDAVYLGATVPNLDHLHGTINVNGNPLGVDNLIVNDQANSAAQTFTLESHAILRTGAAVINYNNLLNNLFVSTGTGADTVNVQATSLPVTLTGHGSDTVNVGNAGSVQQILAPLTITDPPAGAFVTLNVDDSTDSAAPTATLDSVGDFGRITGLAPAAILYKYLDTSTVTVQTGTGGGTVNVLATGKPTSVVGHATGTVNVGNAGSVQQILAPLTVSDPPASAFATVNVDDSADVTGRNVCPDTVTIAGSDYGRITGLARPPSSTGTRIRPPSVSRPAPPAPRSPPWPPASRSTSSAIPAAPFPCSPPTRPTPGPSPAKTPAPSAARSSPAPSRSVGQRT